MRTVATIALLIAVSVCFIGHAAVGSATAAPVSVNDSDEIVAIRILPNGDADISVIRTVSIETQNDSAAFNKTARQYRKGGGASFGKTDGADDSLQSFRQAAHAVGNESNRSMRIVNIKNDTSRRNDTGIFYRNFTWTSFTVPPEGDEAVNLNESFTVGDRPWISSLREGQMLVISVSEGYEITKGKNVDKIEGNTWVYEGQRTFQQFDIAYREETYQQPEGEENTNRSGAFVGLVALVALVVAGSVGAFAYSRRRTLIHRITADRNIPLPGRDGADTPRSANEHETGTGMDAAAVMGPAGETDTRSTTDGVDIELLSDEERVERLLRTNGGRMRQATIVTETGWSDAKVSQLLSAMDEDERIEKLRIGRENLISLPNHDHDHSGDDQNRS